MRCGGTPAPAAADELLSLMSHLSPVSLPLNPVEKGQIPRFLKAEPCQRICVQIDGKDKSELLNLAKMLLLILGINTINLNVLPSHAI